MSKNIAILTIVHCWTNFFPKKHFKCLKSKKWPWQSMYKYLNYGIKPTVLSLVGHKFIFLARTIAFCIKNLVKIKFFPPKKFFSALNRKNGHGSPCINISIMGLSQRFCHWWDTNLYFWPAL